MTGRHAPGTARNRVADLASLLSQGALAVFFFRQSSVSLSFGSVAGVAALMVCAVFVAISLHELGHLVAGELVSWRWRVLKAGPLLLVRDGDGVRSSLARDPRYRGIGLVVNEPTSARASVPSRQIVMLLGGPVASLGLALTSWALWSKLEGAGWLGLAAGVLSAASLVVLVTTLAPIRSSGHLSDGGKIWALLRGRPLSGKQLDD